MEFLQNLLYAIITAAIPVLTGFLCKWLASLYENNKSKIKNEKVQLVLVMSRKAKIYILDEPLGGVDPASRDYILKTILKNFDENATLLISTHMIADIEKILDEVIFIDNGEIIIQENADELRKKENCSIDEIFRRKFYVN